MARLRWTRWISVALVAALLAGAGAAAGPPGDAAPELDPAGEIVSERTATTASYDLGGGRYAAEAFAEPVFYRPKGSGAFVPIEAGV